MLLHKNRLLLVVALRQPTGHFFSISREDQQQKHKSALTFHFLWCQILGISDIGIGPQTLAKPVSDLLAEFEAVFRPDRSGYLESFRTQNAS